MPLFRFVLIAAFSFCATAFAQSGLWSSSVVPGTPEVANDAAGVNLGVKFYSDVPGTITAVRFYKGPHNTGTHVGNVWSSSGTKLASVTFSGESAAGWQQAALATPLKISANTTYVVSYFAPKGSYASDEYYVWKNVAGGSLHVSGSSPGTYVYGSAPAAPNSTWHGTNYWVDLVFVPTGSQPVPTPSLYSISGTAGGSGATVTLSGAASGVVTADAAGSFAFAGIPNGSYVIAPSQNGYSFSPSTAAVAVNGAPVTSVTFTRTALPTPVPHSVSLNWTPSTSSNIVGYNLYRTAVPGGAYSKVNAASISGVTYIDTGVVSGYTYYYVATAVDANNVESGYSNQAVAAVPTP